MRISEKTRDASSAPGDLDVETTVQAIRGTLKTKTDLEAAVDEMLPVYVRWCLRSGARYGVQGDTDVALQPRRGGGASFKVAAAREWWQKRLEERYSIGHRGTYKRLADMTTSDLVWLADDFTERSAAFAAKAVTMRRLAEAVESAGVESVSALPGDVIAEALNGGRA